MCLTLNTICCLCQNLQNELNYMMDFYPIFCVFQDLPNGRVLGIGKEEKRLYLLTSQLGGIQK